MFFQGLYVCARHRQLNWLLRIRNRFNARWFSVRAFRLVVEKAKSIVVARIWARMGARFHPLKSHLYLSVLQTKQTIFVDVVFVVVVALNCIARFTCCHLMYFYVIFLLFCFQYQRFSVSRWNGSQKSNNNKNCINESKQCEWKWCYKKPQRVSISLKPKQLQCLVNMWINY